MVLVDTFMESCTYMMAKLPLNDKLLTHCEVVDAYYAVLCESKQYLIFLGQVPMPLNHTPMEQLPLYQTENILLY